MKRIALAFLFLVTGAISVFAQDDTRATATWQVQKYDINATVPQSAADRNLSARATLTLKNVSGSPATSLTLRISPNAAINSITVNGNTADFSKREERLADGGTLQRASVRIPAAAPGATISAAVDYKLAVKDNSGLNAIAPNGSQFLPLAFWYPTPNSWFFARGADHAPFRISITAPGRTAVSSGTGSASTFEQTFSGQPFFVAGNWDVVDAAGVSLYLPVGTTADEQKRARDFAAIVGEAKAFVSAILGPAPEIPVRLVTTRRGAGFAGGGTILIDEAVFRRSKPDSLSIMNLAEAVARLWIGNSISVSGDGQGVVKEGLVRYIATEFIENKYGKEVADIERMRQRAAYTVVSRRDAPLTSVTPIDDYYYPAVANKGAMVWRILARRVGANTFAEALRAGVEDKQLSLAEVRSAFSTQKELLDYELDQVTDMNLLVGLPQSAGGETRVALRNTGAIDATVNVVAVAANGEKIPAQSTIRAKEFGEVSFRTPQRIVRVEVDNEKLYPQTDYSDDIAPREFTDSDLILAVKRLFDKQDFAGAEKAARIVLREYPRLDDVRILLGRALFALGRNADAEREFKAVIEEPLPSARSIAWANVGLAQTAAKNGQTAQALKFADDAIHADAEYGASLAARNLRNSLGAAGVTDESVKAFFAAFDKAAAANRKAEIDSMVVPGEVTRFASGVAGQTQQWQTQVQRIDRVGPDTVLAETTLTVKLLNGEPESGLAVFRLTKMDGVWRLSGVEMYEVR